MVCPFCENSNSKVVESRESPDGVRRRRECSRCGLRFTTYERVYKKSIMIIKRDGRREPFSQEKLENSLVLACAKRPLEVGKISRIVVDIETELNSISKLEIESYVIGEVVMDKLKKLDQVAYIRYASVYRNFQDEKSFTQAIESLNEIKEKSKTTNKNQLRLIKDDLSEFSKKRKHQI